MPEMQIDTANISSYLVWILICISMAIVGSYIVFSYMVEKGLIGGG